VDGRDCLGDLDIYGRITLKCTSQNDVVNMCPALNMFKNGSRDDLFSML
jgi:hypothetical protein